ncbi:MAG: secretin N-terminal domain-containing protein [Pseudobdellovibrio sp.]
MKTLFTLLLITASTAFAQEKINFNFNNEEITKIIQTYSKESGQKFVIDSTVRGKITILNPEKISKEEAFNALSEGLAINGFGIVKNEDVFTVRNARSAQRDNLQVSTALPAAKPQRMATWVINLQNISAGDVQKDLRLLTSSYGELSSVGKTNQIVITDWTSNLQRVAALIKEVDVPVSDKIAKLAATTEKKESSCKCNKKSEDAKN